ncbi:MAG: bacterioferritin [Dehalococcoidia bacterium]
MKAKPGVVDLLNLALTNELTAINQYFVHAAMCENWGFARLYRKMRALALDEMKDTEELIKHILYLEGVPNLQRLNTVRVGETVEEILELGRQTEVGAVETLREGIALCAQVEDYTTRNILEEMIREEEGHVDFFETQLETVRLVGITGYLAQQIVAD